jgi:hypothetical protein
MTGETEQGALIRSMRPELKPGVYVFTTMPAAQSLPDGIEPLMAFREPEGWTFIVERDRAHAAGLAGIYPCRMITLTVHSSLEAVGFLAAVTTRLAQAGISVNPISGFHHDHLFVPAERAGEAMEILAALSSLRYAEGCGGIR